MTFVIVEGVNSSLKARPHRYRWFSISFRFGREFRPFRGHSDYITLDVGKPLSNPQVSMRFGKIFQPLRVKSLKGAYGANPVLFN